jgi:hypothetical protein
MHQADPYRNAAGVRRRNWNIYFKFFRMARPKKAFPAKLTAIGL